MADRLLLIDDDDRLGSLLRAYLADHGFVLERAGTLALGRQALSRGGFDALILDRMLPDGDGMTLCRELRASSSLPIVMLTAMGEETDRIVGLELGADDYLQKPMNPRELVARVSAVLRRVRPALAGEALTYADLEMDTVGHKVRRSGEVIPLGPTEFRLLKHFLEHPGHVFSRERLLDSVWGHDSDIESRTVDVHIRRLRKAINEGGRPDIIRTVRSAGYALDAGH